jgi:outer membrane lipoprotein-sorting protein
VKLYYPESKTMHFLRKTLIVCLLALIFSPVVQAQSQARLLVEQMSRSMDQLVTVSAKLKRTERINGVMESGTLSFKLNTKPRKIYIYNYAPDEGAELLYADGWNDNKVFVHPNKFPWVNISLQMNSSELLDKQHHSMTALGFEFTNGIVKHLLKKYDLQFDEYVKYTGQEKWYGKMLDVIKITYKDYKIENYTVLAGEDLLKIESKLKVPAQRILELNSGIDDFFDVKAGQVVKVPNVYGKEFVIMIDPSNHLPIVQIVMDDKGLFEKYEYSEVKVNPRFSTLEFSEDNEAYGF